MTDRYRYRAAEASGRVVRGVLEAGSPDEATCALIGRGLCPIQVAVTPRTRTQNPVATRQLALVFRSLASLREAGVPLARALRCTVPLTSGRLREALEQAIAQLHSGSMLADALDNDSEVLPPLIAGMLRAGERAGQLSQALVHVAEQLEHEAEFQARLRQALAYPLLLIVAGCVSIGIVVGIVVPRFAVLLAEFGQELPPTTRLLLGMSQFVQRAWPFLLVALAVACVVLWQRWQTREGRRAMQAVMLSLPWIGTLRHALATARVLRAFSAALFAGVPVLPALRAAGEAAGDDEIRARLEGAEAMVSEGQPASISLAQSHALTTMATDLLAVGEGSGQLGVMAGRAARLVAAEAERKLQTMVRLLEPALVVAFGGAITFVAAALLQAVYSIRPGTS